jgi:class 3 adenylate cyclase
MKLATLTVEGPDGATTIPLGPETSIGRTADNTVVLDDARVSRRHALIRLQATGEYVLSDLGSANGTVLNGRRLALPARLVDGDVLEIGSMRLVFSGDRPAPEAPADILTTMVERRGRESPLLGAGPAMTDVFRLLTRAAASHLPVLLIGETGTGKELAARRIHAASARAVGPFVAVRASEAAAGRQRDLAEEAGNGTLFLDEVGELPARAQTALFRLVAEGETGQPPRVRVISSTARDLGGEVARGKFRGDLYYRLAALTVRMPPLRERREDIPLLAAHLVTAAARAQGKRIPGIDADALDVLARAAWPGNVRELENALERAVALASEGVSIGMQHLAVAPEPVRNDASGHRLPDLRRHAAPDGTVTLMFSDMENFSGMTARLGDIAAQKIIGEHNRIVREQLAAHGGHEVYVQGDGFLLAFGSARRALHCAIAMHQTFAAYSEAHPEQPIRVRIGVHTGEAIPEPDGFFGKTVILASRIAAQAEAGELLVSALVKELTESAGDLHFGPGRDTTLKGLPGTYTLYPVSLSARA